MYVLGGYVLTELGLCVVRWPYLSLSVADLDTCLLPLDNRITFVKNVCADFYEDLDINFVVTVFDPNNLFGNVARLPVSVVNDEYQKAKARKRRLSYTPLPRLARAALSANGLSSTSSTSAEVMPNRDLLVDAHRRLIGEVFLLRSKVQDMIARRDLLVQQVKASTRWELMKEWLEKRVEHWNPEEEYRRHLFLSGGINHQSGGFSQAATLRSVIGSRFSEEPSF
ncbi:hypothetical protein F2Q69_00005759 [Brassica cretica]|uniref:Uncharacterized protein n=1 Tax=Brassica cretica TaxID=69181 RepID=A0A8S9PA36_BRACR|nr:hypothetical protein F2Q69_00005759 [Brassica cretica]